MSNRKKNKNSAQKADVSKQVDYYRLKTKAVEDLATADESNSPEVPEEELRKYRSGSGIKLPEWVKLSFIKFWFPAAVCFFFLWGLGGAMAQLDLLVVTAIALGMVTDLLTNNVLRFIEKTPGGNDRWMMFPKKGYASFPLNILYAFAVLFFVYMLYTVINWGLLQLAPDPDDALFLGVEPILFGLFYFGVDTLFITFKHLFLDMIHNATGKPTH